MLDIRKKKVKAIYFNAFHCPECGLELHQDNIVLTSYPPQYCYYCDCGFRTTSFQQPGIEYEFEEEEEENENSLPNYPEMKGCSTTQEMLDYIIDKWNQTPLRTFTASDCVVEAIPNV